MSLTERRRGDLRSGVSAGSGDPRRTTGPERDLVKKLAAAVLLCGTLLLRQHALGDIDLDWTERLFVPLQEGSECQP